MTALCKCGCGLPAPIATQTNTSRGHRKGHPVSFRRGHHRRRDIDARLELMTDRSGQCWVWTGQMNNAGYGTVYYQGRTCLAHRVAYERAYGPIPDGLEIDHTCRNPACVNPAHLEAVDHLENMRRALPFREYPTRTHCARGHEFTPENEYWSTNRGRAYRRCRACMKAGNARHVRAYKERKRAATIAQSERTTS